ncbi:low molecular weight protein-tyrosine-phosphatase [Nocardioides solisilvae]|uniref:low molecular weight protein-tyrosine-phosphatase n=1 Tax=Nocardioides solisilvae TaxID=1542435 RepID=UPI000D74AD70|nr:low molecular weight protein-tyrosine-phosphatase [Nocardioides solisilvae]
MATARVPAPRTPGRYRVGVVCLGNICRSPMAHVVLEQQVADAGLAHRVEVVSSGTAGWHVGKPMDHRAAATLTAAGYDATRHRARQLEAGWFDDLDLVLVMDRSNETDVVALAEQRDDPETAAHVRMFRDFDPADPGGEVPDPYYGGDEGFTEVLRMVERTSTALVEALGDALAGSAGP